MFGEDIRNVIKMHKSKLEIYKTQKNYLIKVMIGGPAGFKEINYSGMPHGKGATTITLDREYLQLQTLEEKIILEESTIHDLQEQLDIMLKNIKNFKGLDLKIEYMKQLHGMKLQEIADSLNYEESYIRKLSCFNHKKKGL